MEQVKAIIQAVLEREFENVQIESIEVREGEDFDGDDILYVTVVFRSARRLDSNKTAAIVRHVRPKLHEIHEDRFPVMSFISEGDIQGKLAEAV